MLDRVETRDRTRGAIIDAAARLLREGGPVAVTTRAVAGAAGVQPPTIYRLFGDKDGLLDAVAERVMADFVSAKAVDMAEAATANADPLHDLKHSWQLQIDFGLANPALFRLLSDPERVRGSSAASAGREVLAAVVHRLAAAGRIRVPEALAVSLIQAAVVGTIHLLLATPAPLRDPKLAETMQEAVLGRILVEASPPFQDGPIAAAVSLRALAPQLHALSQPERRLLSEWLDRIASAAPTPSTAQRDQD